MRPIARTDQITTEELSGETLVYDLKRHRAHCLNATASAVWKYCDGKTTIAEMADRLHGDFGLPADESLVRMALQRLQAAGLVEAESVQAAPAPLPSRRDISRRLSIRAALVLPLVTSIVAPTAAVARSRQTGPGQRPPRPPRLPLPRRRLPRP